MGFVIALLGDQWRINWYTCLVDASLDNHCIYKICMSDSSPYNRDLIGLVGSIDS